MNLELNLENKVITNPNLEHFTKSPITINGDNITLGYLGGSSAHGYVQAKELISLNNLYNYLDEEEFAYETGMRDIVEFREYLERMHNTYKRFFNDDEEFNFGVTKKYSYARGTYDTVKTLVNRINKFQMRPAGMLSIFNRISDNQWAMNNFSDNMRALEAKRFKAQQASGNLVDNVGELVANQQERYNKIIDSTNQANQMSDNFDVVHAIDGNIEDHIVHGNFTAISLYTLVKCSSKEMTIVNNHNDEICKMMVPTTYLMFKRPLWRALTTDRYYIQDLQGSCPGAYHPYINSYPFHSYEDDYNITDDQVAPI